MNDTVPQGDVAPQDAASPSDPHVTVGLAAMAEGEGGVPPSATPEPSASPSPNSWDILKDPVAKAWVTNKGLPDVQALAKSAMNAEKMLGKPTDSLIEIPKDQSPETMRPIWEKLGAGQRPEDYQLPVPEGQDGAFAQQAAQWMYEAGVPVPMAQQLAEKWNEYVGGVTAEQSQQIQQRDQAQVDQLKLEWGQNFNANLEIAMRAADEFGIDDTAQEALKQALGPGQAARILLNIGSKLASDDGFVGGEIPGFGTGGSPEQAREQIRQLQRDKDFGRRFVAGDTQARQQMERLQRIAYPGQTQL